MPEIKLPRTPEAWQDCVDACYVAQAMDSMFQFGLISPNPNANLPRCEWLLNVGKHKGYEPIYDNVIGVLREIITL